MNHCEKNKKTMTRKFIIQNEIENEFNHYSGELDFNSIAEWIACGFFLGNNDFTKLKFGSNNKYKPKSKWFYNPRNITFKQACDEFSDIFESIILNKVKNNNIVLPLSGGLDSRTLAASLFKKKNIKTYSYEFQDGIKETKYGKAISDAAGWDFQPFIIERGYLWDKIDELAQINLCQSDFTHPRQMAVIDKVAHFGDLLLHGQWGDVLFDLPKLNKKLSLQDQVEIIKSKIVKPGGLEFSKRLWEEWGLHNNFDNELQNHINDLLLKINIDNPSRRIQAFKSLHWATRWANPNLKIFSKYFKLFTPYYEDEICNLICTLPDEYLMDRRIQINYIKNKSKMLSKIPWQPYDLDLYKYQYFNNIYFPRRLYRYFKRGFQGKILNYLPIIERNWELQFLGKLNEKNLKFWLFENKKLNNIVSKELIKEFYDKFKYQDPIKYSHPISMLLTLSVWCEKFWKKK